MAIAAGLSAAVYLAAGLAQAYLVADDFQWLVGADTFDWGTLVHVDRNHFYRPTTILWFRGAAGVCGETAGCYHALNIGLHAANVALVYVLVRLLATRASIVLNRARWRETAFAAALLFGLQPAFVQAVSWVSAVTGLLAAAGVLVALVCQVRAWQTPGRAWLFSYGAVVAFAFAVFAHEAAATLPAVSLLMAWVFAPSMTPAPGPSTALGPGPSTALGPGAATGSRSRARVMYAGFAIVLMAFALSAVLANRENYVFREGHYAVGLHMIRNAFDYLVSLWVGPHTVWAYVLTGVGLALLARVHPLSRFGVLWTLVTLVPYVGFTWGNVGRYSYLPAIGFAIALAGVLAWLAEAPGRRRPWLPIIIMLAVMVRFAGFTLKSARGDAAMADPVREYVTHIRTLGATPVNGVIEVPAPVSPHVDPQVSSRQCSGGCTAIHTSASSSADGANTAARSERSTTAGAHVGAVTSRQLPQTRPLEQEIERPAVDDAVRRNPGQPRVGDGRLGVPELVDVECASLSSAMKHPASAARRASEWSRS